MTTSTSCLLLRVANLRIANQNILPATRSTDTKTIFDAIVTIITSSLHTPITTSDIKQPAAVTLLVKIHVSHAAHARELKVRRARGGEAVNGGVARPEEAGAVAPEHAVAVVVVGWAGDDVALDLAAFAGGDGAGTCEDVKVCCGEGEEGGECCEDG